MNNFTQAMAFLALFCVAFSTIGYILGEFLLIALRRHGWIEQRPVIIVHEHKHTFAQEGKTDGK